MVRIPAQAFCCALALAAPLAAFAQPSQIAAQSPPEEPSYASIAKLVLAAPLIVDAQIRTADRLKPAEAAGVAAGHVRLYVEADVLALIRGTSAMPSRILYLVDLPLDARGRPPKLKKARVLLFARPVAGYPDRIQLVGPDAQRGWGPSFDARVRGIIREVLASDAPPVITGVGNAFHVPGSLPGEGETQIFLTTSNDAPVSLQVLRRPGEATRWSVSTGDFIDESAGAPAKDTLLWFRLACGLPREIPSASLEADDPANARVAREDYRTVLRELGPCA